MSPSAPVPVRHKWRRRFLLAGWLVACIAIILRAGIVQVLQAPHWRDVALSQHRETQKIPAARGPILDRNGYPLADSHETFRVGIAPRELPAPKRSDIVLELAASLDLPRSLLRKVSDPDEVWVHVPGTYPPRIQENLRGIRGVHLSRELDRYYPHGAAVQGVIGNVVDGVGDGGIEGLLEEHLRGTPGEEVRARDHTGQPIPGQSVVVRDPVQGGGVVLTLDQDLQEIAHTALSTALRETGAKGGDLLISAPKTGELLAMVSLRDRDTWTLSTINTPYEPGSTLKPFIVAGILLNQVGSLEDSVDTEEGWWRVAGRTVRDIHPHGKITLADALRVSSNVGIGKAAQALSPAQQYQILRDFGFGTYTGVSLPGENPGKLRRPDRWSGQSQVSLAIGYEIGVTPLQMVMAYGALANGGKLMEPRLIREIRDPRGRLIEESQPRIIREVIPESLAREISNVLAEVVEDGTGTQAHLSTFAVAGKSGTSRAYHVHGGYEPGAYYSSFVCFFPVEDPQLVVYVKLDRPEGAYYGGATAAPVTRAILEAVLAARQAPIDREALASLTRRQPRSSPLSGAQFASNPLSSTLPPRTSRASNSPETDVAVPDVSGLSSRLAVRRLHSWGFRVLLESPGPVYGTVPRAGTPLAQGDTVRILVGRSSDG